MITMIALQQHIALPVVSAVVSLGNIWGGFVTVKPLFEAYFVSDFSWISQTLADAHVFSTG